ncbi:MAG: SDR family NAD(P)-dependent oxidoreductase [Pseudomonadota bacterium]
MNLIESFGPDARAAVIGAGGGVGAALADRLAAAPNVAEVVRMARSGGDMALDLTNEASIAAAAEAVGDLHLVICAAGVLHGSNFEPEKTWRALDPAAMAEVMAVNAVGPALLAKHFLPRLPKGRKTAFAALSARVGSIGDNRLGGWVSYRASKAALNQVIRTFSIELARKRPEALIVGLHPGTVDTGLSEPFQRGHDLFTPAQSAEYLLKVLDGLTAEDSGGVFAWDGDRIPD